MGYWFCEWSGQTPNWLLWCGWEERATILCLHPLLSIKSLSWQHTGNGLSIRHNQTLKKTLTVKSHQNQTHNRVRTVSLYIDTAAAIICREDEGWKMKSRTIKGGCVTKTGMCNKFRRAIDPTYGRLTFQLTLSTIWVQFTLICTNKQYLSQHPVCFLCWRHRRFESALTVYQK